MIKYNKNNEKVESYDVSFSSTNHRFSKMHSISSYLAMFNPKLASFFINEYSNEGDLVVDNFSGRGTTLLLCRETNRHFYGTDLNPYAYMLSKSKQENLCLSKLVNRVHQIENEYNNWKMHTEVNYTDDSYKDISAIYSKKVLNQLIFFREKYGKNWIKLNQEDTFICVIMLGLMHGPQKVDKTGSYFSVSMPNTFSMSPNYVRKYVEQKKLKYNEENIFPKIIRRIQLKYENIDNRTKININFENAMNSEKLKKESVDLFFTSPPYLNIINYTNDNWIRLWLLGYTRETIKTEIELDDKHKFEKYCSFIEKYMNSKYDFGKKTGKMVLVVGDVKNKNSNMTFENVLKNIKTKWKLKEYFIDEINKNNKTTNMINANSTTKERIYVFEK